MDDAGANNADDDRASVASEPFSSGPEDDDDAPRQDPTEAAAGTDGDDDGMPVASPRSSRRVTFDENAPDTLVFTPEPGTGGRGSDDEDSVATGSTDSDSEETSRDSFQRLLEMLRERSLTPVGRYSDEEGEPSGPAALDPNGHVARYLREQQGRQPADDDESDIQEGEVHPFREERRPAFPNEPTPGQRRTSFAETIDEFLQYLQVITEDHKAHQEALMLLDEEPLPADGSDAASSEAGDSAWSETGSELADSVSEAGSVHTEVDSGLATSPPPLTDGEEESQREGEDRAADHASGVSGVNVTPETNDRDETAQDDKAAQLSSNTDQTDHQQKILNEDQHDAKTEGSNSHGESQGTELDPVQNVTNTH